VYVNIAVPVESVVPLPVVVFGPVTVNCTATPEIGVAVVPVPFFSKAASVCVVPVTSGLAKGELRDSVKEIGSDLTVIVTFELVLNCESFAVSCKTYVPYVENVTWVLAVLGLVNVTVPGPLTFVHEVVSVLFGSPSSVTLPSRVTVLVGNTIVWSGPASTAGA